MTIKYTTKFVHEGNYVAEVKIEVIESDTEWSPYLSVAEARKLDDVREALRAGDLKKAATLGRIYQLTHIAV